MGFILCAVFGGSLLLALCASLGFAYAMIRGEDSGRSYTVRQ
jgi:hypothetical protein